MRCDAAGKRSGPEGIWRTGVRRRNSRDDWRSSLYERWGLRIRVREGHRSSRRLYAGGGADPLIQERDYLYLSVFTFTGRYGGDRGAAATAPGRCRESDF